MKFLLGSVSALLALLVSVSADGDVDAALRSDDQCTTDDCALNALQVRKAMSNSEEELDDEEELDSEDDMDEESEEESEWAKDISITVKKHFKAELVVLQTPIKLIYGNLSELEGKVNHTIKEVENATGEEVIWNSKALLQKLLQEDEDESPGFLELEERHEEELGRSRRRRRRHTRMPPRARYVMKIIKYLDKEMVATWDLYTIVDRKRYGILNTIISHPYGPRGKPTVELDQEDEEEEQDDEESTGRRRRRRSKKSADDDDAPVAEKKRYKNKYAQELQEAYEALVADIGDCKNKTQEVRGTLAKATIKAHLWMQRGPQ